MGRQSRPSRPRIVRNRPSRSPRETDRDRLGTVAISVADRSGFWRNGLGPSARMRLSRCTTQRAVVSDARSDPRRERREGRLECHYQALGPSPRGAVVLSSRSCQLWVLQVRLWDAMTCDPKRVLRRSLHIASWLARRPAAPTSSGHEQVAVWRPARDVVRVRPRLPSTLYSRSF